MCVSLVGESAKAQIYPRRSRPARGAVDECRARDGAELYEARDVETLYADVARGPLKDYYCYYLIIVLIIVHNNNVRTLHKT